MKAAVRLRRKGLGLFYSIVFLLGLCAIASFAVDLGRVVLVKTQLRAAADAAALAAAGSLRNGMAAARSEAIKYIGENVPEHVKDAVKANAKVTFGYWGDPQDLIDGPDDEADLTDEEVDIDAPDEEDEAEGQPVFTPMDLADGRVNAVKVELRRAATDGTALNMVFAQLFGQKYCDVHASAVAIGYTGGAGDGFIGIKKLKMHKKGYTDSYLSDWGAYGAYPPREHGSIKTNKTKLKLKKDVVIHGDARGGMGKKSRPTQGGTVTGSREPLDYILSFPPVEQLPKKKPHPKPPKRGNFELKHNQTYTLTAGTYRYHDFKIDKDSTLNLIGEVELIIEGKFEAKGIVNTYQNKPANLRIRMVGKKSVKVGKQRSLYADIYAPLGKAKLDKDSVLYGALIAKDLKAGDRVQMHYDESLATRFTGSALVQ